MFNEKFLGPKIGRGSLLILTAAVVLLLPQRAATEIKIGLLAPMEITTGKHMIYAARMASEEINSAGGIKVGGTIHKIKLVEADSNELASIPTAVNMMEKLATLDRVNVILGGFRTEAALACLEVMADNKVIFGGCSVAGPELLKRVGDNYDKYKYFFRITMNSINYISTILAHVDMVANAVRKQTGIAKPKVALLFEKAAYTDPMVGLCQDRLPKMGMEIAGVWRPSPLATDVTAELSAVKAAGAQIIMEVSNSPFGVVLNRQWGELQIPTAMVGINGEAQSKAHWVATNGMCDYALLHQGFGRNKITEKTIPFYDHFLQRHGDFPAFSTNAYDALYILKQAIEKAGILNPDAIVPHLENTDYVGVFGKWSFSPKGTPYPHDPKWGPGFITQVGVQWRDGKQVVVWPDGRAVFGDEKWAGCRYEGTQDYVLPPRVITYWKGK